MTRGAVDHLKRHELQGVIAHEFSHILNGDMRLNIHLAALLKGITFIGDMGHILLRSSNRARTGLTRRDNNYSAMMPFLGLAFWLLGLVGAATAGFIKAAISRQKEYLADASAVQFTRSPDGIGDALKVIGGYSSGTLVHAARATEMSHIFFGEIVHRLWTVFATHPPLRERIRRIDPGWNGQYIERKVVHYDHRPPRGSDADVGVGRAAIVAAAVAASLQPAEPEQADADFGPAGGRTGRADRAPAGNPPGLPASQPRAAGRPRPGVLPADQPGGERAPGPARPDRRRRASAAWRSW